MRYLSADVRAYDGWNANSIWGRGTAPVATGPTTPAPAAGRQVEATATTAGRQRRGAANRHIMAGCLSHPCPTVLSTDEQYAPQSTGATAVRDHPAMEEM